VSIRKLGGLCKGRGGNQWRFVKSGNFLKSMRKLPGFVTILLILPAGSRSAGGDAREFAGAG
jgi:hypothetical protein